VQRQLSFLRQIPDIHITVAAFGEYRDKSNIDTYIQLPRNVSLIQKLKAAFLLKLKMYDSYDCSFGAGPFLINAIRDCEFDLVIANELEPLLVAYAKEPVQHKVLLDAHEYSPLQFEDKWRFRFFFQDYMDYLCKRYLKKVDAMVTVSEGLQAAYLENYGVRAEVITNAPFYKDLKPKQTLGNNIRLIYHGVVSRTRKTDLFFDLIEKLDDRFTLDLMMVPASPRYYEYINQEAKKHKRIKIVKAVKPGEIAGVLNQYDIGVYMMAPVNFNHRHALPNKLFEFIQARLAVALWPTPGMAKIVRATNCGILSDEYTVDSLARALNGLTAEQIDSYKENSSKAASVYCAEKNQAKFCDLVKRLV
jgi:glycosyltransferase involved in cell wall biosynthesis